jgi:hypothetical protein
MPEYVKIFFLLLSSGPQYFKNIYFSMGKNFDFESAQNNRAKSGWNNMSRRLYSSAAKTILNGL